ncbi:MAG: Phosphate transport system permease protein PstA [Bryobacterales bacterium]|nr:Phosphate transport system permease protein PstA [Bryobacterales bacterium]
MTLSFRRRAVNAVMLTLTGLCTVFVAGILFVILGYLAWNGARSLSIDFFTKLPVPIGQTGGGMANAIVGSAKVLLVALLMGVPIGFLGGVYLAEFGQSAFSSVVRYVTDLLNGVPSIVIGIFAYAVVVKQIGFSTLAGGFALGIMMIPIALRTTEEFLRAVPVSLREGSMALGASKTRTIFAIVIPAAKSGILSGLMLNLARVAGETAPLLFTSFGSPYWSYGWLQPTATLPVMIYTYAISPYEDWHRQAWAAGFVLLTLVLAVNVAARFAIGRSASHR